MKGRARTSYRSLMRHKSFIAIAAMVVLLLVGAVGVSAYDSSNGDKIAEGVTVAGVDLGGMTADEARVQVRRQVAGPLQKPIVVTSGGKRFTLSAEDAGIHADADAIVDEALAASREGSIFSRVWRDATGGEKKTSITPQVTYSKAAANKLVARVAESVDRPAQDAKLEFPSLAKVDSKEGFKVDSERLRTTVATALTDPDHRVVAAPTTKTKPKVSRDQLARKYPTLLVVERANFKLKLYKDLKLKKAYTIAVGQQGLETPEGLYAIQNKAVNAAWTVPNSPWAGDMAGQVVPGGSPENPLKARWMGIFAGAGIHGTDETASLGSAASHGCVRMAIPDVIELYDQVPVHTPIYIG
jgi:lipoprotein-anchoring transpeptidase ErfK/SrfK